MNRIDDGLCFVPRWQLKLGQGIPSTALPIHRSERIHSFHAIQHEVLTDLLIQTDWKQNLNLHNECNWRGMKRSSAEGNMEIYFKVTEW